MPGIDCNNNNDNDEFLDDCGEESVMISSTGTRCDCVCPVGYSGRACEDTERQQG